MLRKNRLNEGDVVEVLTETPIRVASGGRLRYQGNGKQLFIRLEGIGCACGTCKVTYIVSHNGFCKSTNSLKVAVAHYNSI